MNLADKRKWLAARMQERPQTPDGERGGMRVHSETCPAHSGVEVVSMRNAIFQGEQVWSIRFDEPWTLRHLSYEGGEWMSDSPQELWQMFEPLEDIAECVAYHGACRVLVGGLGLGVFSRLAAQYAGADVTTIEKDARVIELVAAGDPSVVEGDIYKYCSGETPTWAEDYDFALLDTWQSTGEYCWVNEVVPLRRLVAPKIPRLHCWNEREMIGQVVLNGYRSMLVGERFILPNDVHRHVLRRRALELGIVSNATSVELTDGNVQELFAREAVLRDDWRAQDLLRRFTANVGSERWEEEFGSMWDNLTKAKSEARR